jgi:hypothetical protein
MTLPDEFIAEVEKGLVDRGLIIEAGWQGLRLAALPHDAPQEQLDAMRDAFFAGAQHLYVTLMRIMDPGPDETDDDLRRMDLIDDELRRFIKGFAARHGLPFRG